MSAAGGERLTAFEAGCWHLERTGQPMHAGALYVLDGPLDFERTLADVEARLAGLPRWRSRVLPVPFDLASPTWEPARGFDLPQHVVRHGLRAPADDAQLERLASRLFAQPLDRRRPLWEVHQIDGFRGGCSALLVKVHHCLLGGVHGSDLEQLFFDVSARPKRAAQAPAPAPPPGEPSPGAVARLWAAARDGAASGLAGLRRAAADPVAVAAAAGEHLAAVRELVGLLAASAPPTPLRGHVSTLRRVAWITVALPDVKAVKTRLGGTTGDVAFAAIAGGLRRWLELRGLVLDRLELRALCPTGIRGDRAKRLSIVVAPLPVGIFDPRERLRQVRAAREQLERERAAERTARALALLSSVPAPLQRPLGWLEMQVVPVNTICTTVPASPVRLYAQGRRVETIVPMVPLAQGVGLAFGILTYADVLTIGVTFDPALLRDGEALPPLVREAFDELHGLTDGAPLARTGPVSPERRRRVRPVPPRVA